MEEEAGPWHRGRRGWLAGGTPDLGPAPQPPQPRGKTAQGEVKNCTSKNCKKNCTLIKKITIKKASTVREISRAIYDCDPPKCPWPFLLLTSKADTAEATAEVNESSSMSGELENISVQGKPWQTNDLFCCEHPMQQCSNNHN